jgi:hypothetical protein
VKRADVVGDDAELRVKLGGELLRAGLAAADRGEDLDAQGVRDGIKPASVHAADATRVLVGRCGQFV